MSQGTDRQDTVEERILQAAARLLEREGPGFSMEELAREAGVSRATLYRRVPSREALAERLRREGGREQAEPLLVGPARERVLEAARTLVARDGLLSPTVEQVAQAAGVSPVTVYRAFGDKEGLLRALFEQGTPRQQAAALLADPQAPVAETLTRFVTLLITFITTQPGLMRLLLFSQGSEAQYIDRLREQQSHTFQALVRYLATQVERGRLRREEPAQLALALLGQVLAATLLAPRLAPQQQPATGPAEARARALVELFLRGAQALPAQEAP